MTLEEFHKRQSKRRGRRWFFIICAVCLVVMALCLAACSPSLIRVEAPGRNFKSAPVYQSPGKAPVANISDAQLQHWLDGVTGRKSP